MTQDANTQGKRITRRMLIGTTAGALIASGIHHSIAHESTPEFIPIQSTTVGELPTAGGLRPGPVGQQSPQLRAVNPTDPVHIDVEKAGINADIVTMGIVDGVMENPPGPWVVAWYRQTATLGEPGNVVLAGHVDFWDVGPSVFFNVRDLVAGDIITLTGENDSTWDYTVEWSDVFSNEDLVAGKLQEVVGATETPSVTLITCGGEFDYANGEYLSRMVVRGTLIEPAGTPEATASS
ncbi:MAG TPA: class F sortase [Thermomicrobiales bacterium]|nr:class F sortase [Thermomicrobiales bacterium]